jgi:hypothetical protein
MSYDISLECDCCGNAIVERNYTSNVAPILRKVSLDEGIGLWPDWLHNASGPDGAMRMDLIVDRLRINRAVYAPLEPYNGWGSLDGLITLLCDLLRETPEIRATWKVRS